jgi:hypothetical protein
MKCDYCVQGHDLSNGGRSAWGVCKACEAEKARVRRAAKKAKARRFKLPATDPRAISYRLEAARRGIVLKECA